MSEIEPLVPDCVDLRDFAFMPLDVVRLRDSQLAVEASGDEFRAAVLLWCVAWHQAPAASLPDDDRALAQYAGYGRVIKDWLRVREFALRGFVKCSDGRLYHPVLAEKANDAWKGKLKLRHRRECERIKKAAQRANAPPVYPTFDDWLARVAETGSDVWAQPTVRPVPCVSPGTNQECPEGQDMDVPMPVPVNVPCVSLPLKGEGIGDRGQGINKDQEHVPKTHSRFLEFWNVYPNRKGKIVALAKWKSKQLDRIADQILADVQERKTRDREWLDGYAPHASTYLNQERWQDDIDTRPSARNLGGMQGNSVPDLMAGLV